MFNTIAETTTLSEENLSVAADVAQATYVNVAMAAIDALRIKASQHNTTFVVAGRKAMLELMAGVYAQYYAAINSTSYELFMNNVRAKLTTHKIKFRSNSQETSLIIRYIFENFSDKSVHIYGRSLNVAHSLGILPTDFAAFVEGTEGRFNGIRESAVVNPKQVDTTSKQVIALSEAQNEATIDTLEVSDWAEGETYRIFIAVRNADDTADIKDAKMSPESLEKALKIYLENKKTSPVKKDASVSDAANEAILQAELALQNASTKLQTVNADLKNTVGASSNKAALLSQVKWLTLQKEALANVVKKLKNDAKDTANI